MSRQSDAYLAWCKTQGILHPPALAAAAFEAGYDMAVRDAIALLQKDAPLSDGTEQQRKEVISQGKYTLFERALQDIGFGTGKTTAIILTLRRIMEVG